MEKGKAIAITGANGHLGSCLTELMLGQGYTVHAILRPQRFPLHWQHLKRPRVKFFFTDLFDEAALTAAFQGCQGIFHTAAPTFLWDQQPELNIVKPIVEGTCRVIEAAAKAGVQKLIYTSSCAAVGFHSSSRGGEDAADLNEESWNNVTAHPQFMAKREAEQEGAALAEKRGLSFIRVCPPSVLGPHFYRLTPSTEPYYELLRGRMPWIPQLSYHIVDVRDLAFAQWLLYRKQTLCHKRYIVAGPFIEAKTIIEALQTLGLARQLIPRRVIAARGLSCLARLDWLVHKLSGSRRRLTSQLVKECSGSQQRLDISRFMTEFDWKPRPFSTTLADTVHWLQGQEHLFSLPKNRT